MAGRIKTSSDAGARVHGLHHRPLGLLPRRSAYLAAALALAGLTVAAPEAHAQSGSTAYWYGTLSPNWSGTGNWSYSSSGGATSIVPTSGASLRWFVSSTGNRTSTNDIVGLSVAGMSFQGTTGTHTLNGSNKLTLTGAITAVDATLVTFNMPLELNAGTVQVAGGNDALKLNGVISETGGSRQLQVTTGTVTLGADNSFSNGIMVGISAAGAVRVGSIANIGVNQPLGSGTLVILGQSSGTGTLIYTGAGDVSTNKRLQIGRSDSGPLGTAIIRNNGSGVITWSGSQNTTSNFASNRTFILGGTNAGANTWAAAIVNNSASGTVSFIKADAGTWRLSGSNTYSGATSITGGRLEITSAGSINSTSGVTLNGGEFKYNSATALNKAITFTSGTISGTGSIGVAVTAATNNVLSPGNSPGTQAYTTGLTLAPGGTYVWETNSGTGTQGVNWDVINVTAGGLNLSSLSSGAKFNLDLTTLTASGSSGPMDNYTAGGSYTWRIFDANALTLPGSFGLPYTAGTDITSLFNLVTTNWKNPEPGSGNMSVKVAANGTGIDLVVVPEPATLILAGLGVGIAGLMIRHRRRSL